MTPLRSTAAAAAIALGMLGVSGCTGSGDDADAGPSSATLTAPVTPPAPSLAGDEEARALSRLPEGTATGTAVIAYSGLGELRAPFSGVCSHDGDTTVVEGSADTARIRLEAAPEGVQLTLDDVDLSTSSDLATGRYDVSGAHLTLDAPLAHDAQTVGSVQLEVDCG